MFECNRYIHRKLTALLRLITLLIPLLCAGLLLRQEVLAKNIYQISDGDRVFYHTTYATDPEQVLSEAGLALGEEDTFTTQKGGGISRITVKRLQRITIVYRGTQRTVNTYGETVGSLLASLRIAPAANETVYPSLQSKTTHGMTIFIRRTDIREETYTLPLPCQTYYVLDPTLELQQEQLLIPGSDGQIQYVDIVSYVDGAERSRQRHASTVLCQAVDRIIAVGSLDGIAPEQILSQESIFLIQNYSARP